MLTPVIDGNHGDFDHCSSLLAARDDGVLAAIWKATEGLTYNDPRFAEAIAVSRAAGLLVGAYHFLRGAHAGHVQADHFLMRTAAQREAGPLLLCCDWEAADAGVVHARDFVARIREQTGRWPVLYTGQSFVWRRLGREPDGTLGRCPLWLAAYGPKPESLKVQPSWSAWTFQQYTNGGAGPADVHAYPRKTAGFGPHGSAGGVDRSCWRGTADDLRAWWLANAAEPSPGYC